MAKINLLFALSSLSFLILNSFIEGKQLSKEENLELEKKLKQLNKPAVTTIKTSYGDIYDCVDFYKQPAFDHPLLKNHTFHFQMKPNFHAKIAQKKDCSRNHKSPISVKLGGIGCPSGTVPIKRITKNDLIRENQFSEMYDSDIYLLTKGVPGFHFAGISKRVLSRFAQNFGGSQSSLSIYQTPFVGPQQYSSGLIEVETGEDYIQVGWTVNPGMYGDHRPRFFTYLHTAKIRCFNTRCPGFILVNPDIPLGTLFPNVSSPGVKFFETLITIYQDPVNGNWWLTLENDTVIGFWPKHIFSDLSRGASRLFWGGAIYSPPNTPSSPMGTGIKLDDRKPEYNAYHRDVCFIVAEILKLVEPQAVQRVSDFDPSYVDTLDYEKDPKWRRTVYFGGPGGILGD